MLIPLRAGARSAPDAGSTVEALDRGEELPFDVRGQLIYYAGPTPTRPGKTAGAFGPTTAMRMPVL